MLSQIILRTPIWVWALLVALLALGYSQSRDRRFGFRRAFVLPAVLAMLSLLGTLSAFGISPLVLWLWLAVSASVAWAVLQQPVPTGTTYSQELGQFTLPGSWLPMGIILLIFLTKYAVGVSLAIQPALAKQTLFAATIGTLYGLFSGYFTGHMLRLRRLMRQPTAIGLRL